MKTLFSSDLGINGVEFFKERALNHAVKIASLHLNHDESFRGVPALADHDIERDVNGNYKVALAMSNKSGKERIRDFQMLVMKENLIAEMYQELDHKITAAAMSGIEFR